MNDFKDKTAFIFGGSSGIGLAAARHLAVAGARVVVFARGRERLEAAAGEIRQCYREAGRDCAWMSLDVTDADQVTRTVSEAGRRFGVPYLVINSAGRAVPHYFEDVTADMLEATLKVNLHGTRHVCAAVLPLMKQSGGTIVNVSSLAGLCGIFGYTDYCASKFAVIGFSEALKSEVRRYGIHVAVLCPPDTDTPGFHEENKTKPPETKAISANAKLMDPDSVAKALFKGLAKGSFIIIPGIDGKLLFWTKRLAPWIVDAIINRAIKKAAATPDKA